MQRLLPAALSFAVACAHTTHSPSPGAPAPDEIRAVVERYDAAWNRRDSIAVAGYLAPDYVYFSSTGRLAPRAQTLALLSSPAYVLVSAERTELEVTHATEAIAVVSSRWRGHGTWEGEAFRDDQRCSLVLGRNLGNWRILSEHCTQIVQQPTLALTDVTVIDGTGAPPMSGMTIVIEQGRIADIFRADERELPAGATVHDLDGHFIVPGLIDSHVHLFASPMATADSSAIADYFARERARMGRMLRGGVTTVRNMAGRCRATRELARQVELGEVESAEPYFGAVVIGPGEILAGEQGRQLSEMVAQFQRGNPGCRRVIEGPFDPQEVVSAAKATGATGMKLYGDLSGEVADQITEEAHRQGLMVWAHATLFPARPGELVRSGVDVLSHAGHLIWETVDSLPGFVAREGPSAPFERVSPDDSAIKELLRLMAERGTILDPTLLYYELLATAPDTARQTSAAYREARYRWAVDVTRRAHELGVAIAAGTDAMGAEEEGSLPSLPREMEILVSQVGFSPLEAIVSATAVGARALGLEDILGTIAVGKQADLVVLRSDPTVDIRNTRDIAFVVKRGTVSARPEAP